MSPMPEGWSVDVDGENVVLRFPAGDDSGRLVLNRHEARVLRHQLHIAYLLAGRNRFTTVGDAAEVGEEVPAFGALISDRLHLRPVDMNSEQWARYQEFVQRYLGEVEHEAADPSRAVRFVDWENPDVGIDSGAEESEPPAGETIDDDAIADAWLDEWDEE
jgi:hypothetical protein